ncbi:uncharacterized protein FMAN_09659 [Fusarium mangiferae]|uniref:Zn(2)-C6 fungal-type domain-containing protein n=1 Tax=Fusarium mangiferae TaxID=192010 RepID=A0A1L7UJS2_FUSMA|nr:uncharacterized protein FMAN_09659 [Fusarium mangiferae]CVL08017.1 uncharacterized protein FMAN_09659 [Fusarium mangiferae]
MADLDPASGAFTKSGPLRRTHRKSRTGCKACKRSRIKCDETRPVCKNCHRRDAFCEYFGTSRSSGRPSNNVEIIPKQSQLTIETTPVAHAWPTSQASRSSSLSEIFTERTSLLSERLFELQLLHHFVDMTDKATKTQATWSFWILEQATQSISVMDAILGTSASHLQHVGKFKTKLLLISHRYMARAIEVHKKDLKEGLNKSNISRVIATCALICMHANLRAYSLESHSSQRQPHDWFTSSRRALNLFQRVSTMIENPSIGQEFSTLSSIIPHDIHPNPFSFLLYWNPLSALPNEEEIDICVPAVASLSYIYNKLDTEKPLRFPVAVSESFVNLVAAKNPRALAICGYFFMVVKLGRQIWWIDGAPEREFDLVMRCLPRDWWLLMDWAIRVFEWKDWALV